MKKIFLLLMMVSNLSGFAMAQNSLSRDQRDACEALLCLSSGQRPDECAPPLRRYFSISHRKPQDTLRGRTDFLKLCPAAKSDSKMQALVNDIGNGAGRCDAASLNAALATWDGNGTSAIMPGYCANYFQNSYTDLKSTAPLYVGTPSRGGFWVEPVQYSQAVKTYNAKIAAEDAAAAIAAQPKPEGR
jgi:TrbM